MKRNGFCASIDGMRRDVYSRLAEPIEPAAAESAGTNKPPSRNCFMFDMRRREEAEGESRMMGSRRRPGCPGFLRFETRAGFVDVDVAVAVERDFERPR